MADAPIILWFRLDLRLSDHPALNAAVQDALSIIPVFIWDETAEAPWPMGAASKAWLRQSLMALEKRLATKGSRLLVYKGETQSILSELLSASGAVAVYAQRRYEPSARALDASLEKKLARPLKLFEGALLHQPEKYLNKQGKPYQVYTPFSRMLLERLPQIKPLPEPKTIAAPKSWPDSKYACPVLDLPLLPKHEPNWHEPMMSHWLINAEVGEQAARKRLSIFIEKTMGNYALTRDIPAVPGTSALSPHLHFGEISPAEIWQTVHEAMPGEKSAAASAQVFLKEILWREFTHHMLYHFPDTAQTSLRAEFQKFPWRMDAGYFKAWKAGETGYPLVDAGMRELWATGWMHNRVRMVVGSFLVKNLMISWQDGAVWFWDTLVDADLAQNSFNWQWVGGSGADASPYFRVFNPVLQGEKFDAHGDYVKRWVPELAKLDAKWVHHPWDAPQEVLAAAGIEKHSVYRTPVVDHVSTREKALSAYKSIRKGA